MGRIIEERYELTQANSAVTATNTTAAVFTDLWDYQVPVGVRHVLLGAHKLAAFLKDAVAEIAATEQVKIEVRDSAGQSKEVILGPVTYQRIKEFQDRNKMIHLDVTTPIRVQEGDHIVVVVKSATAVVAASSYFALETQRFREGVGR